MDHKFNSSLIGYEKKAIDRQIEADRNACREQLAEKQRILDNLMLENQTLINEKNELLSDSSKIDNLKEKLENIIYTGFIENFMRFSKAENELRNTIAFQDDALNVQEGKSSSIKEKIREFTAEIETEINGRE